MRNSEIVISYLMDGTQLNFFIFILLLFSVGVLRIMELVASYDHVYTLSFLFVYSSILSQPNKHCIASLFSFCLA